MTTNSTRRAFIKKAAWVAAMPTIIPASVLGQNGNVAPSNRITVGGIGLGPRGREVMGAFFKQADVQFVAIADVQKDRREIIRRMANRHHGNEDCKSYPDMQELLARKDIDAVLIATGDRWHTPASVLAARAGKDVYSEKPCAMTIDECRELDEGILKNKRIYQAGTQRRNVPNFQFAADLALSGKLGKLHTVHAGILTPMNNHAPLPGEPEPNPEDINWDAWLGQASARPFNKRYCEGQWRNHQGLAAGYNILEWGSHTVDLCQWAAKADGTTPIEYEVDGGTIYGRYANGMKLVMRLSGFSNEGKWAGLGTCPIRFEGSDGWVEAADSGKLAASDPKLLEGKPAEMPGTDPFHHVRNFLDCIKSRKKTACNSTVARYGHVACHAAAIAWKLGRTMKFDPVKSEFANDAEANGMRRVERRAPWTI